MSVKIPDRNFPNPATINLHPCMTSARYLNAIEESVTITNVCQDSTNTSLVIIDFTLVGAFLFQPTLKILSVDEDTSYQENDIRAPLAVGHFRNATVPINTNCTTFHGQLVFDFGRVIRNFLSAQVIEFMLIMEGTTPISYGVSYPNQTVTSTYDWLKGTLPSPINLTYTDGVLGVTFEYRGNLTCNCSLQCIIPSGVDHQLQFCPNEQQSINIYQGNTSGDPFSVIIRLSDGFGNLSSLEFQSLYTTKPIAPSASVGARPKRVDVSITRLSINGNPIDDSLDYQIFKYHGSETNQKIWKDWSHITWNHFVDYDVIPGETYGYAVRFKGKFGEVSNLSDWTEVTI